VYCLTGLHTILKVTFEESSYFKFTFLDRGKEGTMSQIAAYFLRLLSRLKHRQQQHLRTVCTLL